MNGVIQIEHCRHNHQFVKNQSENDFNLGVMKKRLFVMGRVGNP